MEGIFQNVPRRSTRNSKVKTVKTSTSSVTPSLTSSSDTMGAELSSIDAPISVNFELKVGEEELAKVREWWRQVDGTKTDRQGNDTRGAHYAGGAGNAAMGGAGATRTGGAVSNGTRQQGAHYGRGAAATTSGAVSTMGGAEASQSGSDSTGSVKTRNVTFITGRCHRFGCKVCNGRRIDRMNGLITPSSSKELEKPKTIETITMSDSDEESETLEQMEKRLAKLLELKFRSRNSRK